MVKRGSLAQSNFHNHEQIVSNRHCRPRVPGALSASPATVQACSLWRGKHHHTVALHRATRPITMSGKSRWLVRGRTFGRLPQMAKSNPRPQEQSGYAGLAAAGFKRRVGCSSTSFRAFPPTSPRLVHLPLSDPVLPPPSPLPIIPHLSSFPLVPHLFSTALLMTSPENAEAVYTCKNCGMEKSSRAELTRHERYHIEEL